MPPKPILVLAVGNQLLSDDGVGMALLSRLSSDPAVDLIDGGTQGLSLLGLLEDRAAIVLLDAVALGAPPGSIHVLPFSTLQLRAHRSTTSHEANALELLRFAALLELLPDKVFIAGIEPELLSTGIELSSAVSAAVPAAVEQIQGLISEEVKHVPCCAR